MVAARHGFGDLIGRLDLPVRVPGGSRGEKKFTAERVREALEELGPTFVKLGQLLSTRPDLLPVNYIEEMEKLRDSVPPVEFGTIQPHIEEALGGPIDDFFDDFSPEVLAAASIGQVHRAVVDGQEVVVKVRRPGIERKLAADLDILRGLARVANARIDELKYYDLVGLIDEFEVNIERELDFKREATHTKLFRDNFEGDANIVIPQVLDELSNETLLTMEYVEGVPVGRAELKREDEEFLARVGLRATFQQIFQDGIFHSDPHPGNVLVVGSSSLLLLDFGQVGRVDARLKDQLATLLIAVVERDYEHAATTIIDMGEPAAPVNRRRLTREVADMVDYFAAVSLGDIDLGRVLRRVFRLVNRYRIRYPADYALLLKALVTIEDTVRRLDAEVDVISELSPYMEELGRERWSAQSILRRTRWSLRELFAVWRDLPEQLQSIIEQVNRGQLTIEFKHVGLEGVMKSINHVTNKVTTALVFAALVISSALVLQVESGPQMFGYSVLGLLGYLAAAITGIWLFYLYWR
jgi:ubiquinone biosynthesis protein